MVSSAPSSSPFSENGGATWHTTASTISSVGFGGRKENVKRVEFEGGGGMANCNSWW